ncbi:MAG: glycosyltransferase family 2 protein [Candidatus Omnitrophica bacterium]|nr:glycosyltransferase family 2 protein [Candidatus Omnitrophota bacterium]MBU4479175.1 glycosyltransferase family 2 protein [Candidatus Omnitrophota bacterium]MCG2703975.1 glycosyltransferase family 2 protein [Candidatus Omnitrophota bacterium]
MLYQKQNAAIIVLSRGCGNELTMTLDSIWMQTYKHIKIFLVVSEVEESSLQNIYTSYKDKIKLIIRQGDYSLARVLNNTLKLAHCSYFAIVAAGDVWQSKSLETKVRFLEKNRGAFAVCSDFDVFDKSGIIQDSFFRAKEQFQDLEEGQEFLVEEVCRYLIQTNFRPFSAALIKTESFFFFGPFDETIPGYADLDFFTKVGQKLQLGCINKILVSRYFDIYKVSYYIEENLKLRLAYLEDVRSQAKRISRKYEYEVVCAIRANYSSWIRYLLKSREKNKAGKTAVECMSKYKVTPRLLFLFFKTLMPSLRSESKEKHDYFYLEKVRNDLLKLHF